MKCVLDASVIVKWLLRDERWRDAASSSPA